MARYDEAFVERFLAPWNRHDVDDALALMTDDCVWEVPRGVQGAPRRQLPTRSEFFRRGPCRGRTPGYRHAR
jgi:ketosteroid isomerase-like protein